MPVIVRITHIKQKFRTAVFDARLNEFLYHGLFSTRHFDNLIPGHSLEHFLKCRQGTGFDRAASLPKPVRIFLATNKFVEVAHWFPRVISC